jgi:uncharacterized membrane protein YcaP (DUF421 family)
MAELWDLIGRDGDELTSLQMSARGLIVFAYGLVLVRVAGARVFGKRAAVDIVLAVLVGSNLSRTITGGSPLIATLVTTSVLALAYWLLVGVAAHVKWVGWTIKGSAVQLVEDGRPDRKAMNRHAVSEGELREAMRIKGIARMEDIAAAYLERNGEISVLCRPGA